MTTKIEIFKITMPGARRGARLYESRKAFEKQWEKFKTDWTYRRCFDITSYQLVNGQWVELDTLPQRNSHDHP